MITTIYEFFQTHTNIVSSIVILILIWLGKMIAARTIRNRIMSVRARYVWRQALNVTSLILLIIFMGYTWLDQFRSMFTLLSLVAAALVVINKELLLNLFSSSVLIWRATFVIGDRITIDGITGDVLEIGPFYFELCEVVDHQFTGKTIKLPNSLILTKHIINESKACGYIWNRIEVEFERGQNPIEIRNQLLQIIEPLTVRLDSSRIDQIRKSKIELPFAEGFYPTVIFRGSGEKITATVRYLCEITKVHYTQNRFWEDFLESSVKVPSIV